MGRASGTARFAGSPRPAVSRPAISLYSWRMGIRDRMGRRRSLFVIGASLLSILAGLLLFEISVRILVGTGLLSTPRPPTTREPFWDGSHPTFGVWHHPLSTGAHRTDCFDVTYRANSVGARDKERSVDSEAPRVVVLGDSFVEGWGLPPEQRLTNLLEGKTDIEHLNFGMSHFGPFQSYLAYRDLAKEYSHDSVLIGIVPTNDFFDLDYDRARNAPSYEYRYRPYLTGDYPDYDLIDYRETALRRLLRRSSYGYNAIVRGLQILKGGDELEDQAPIELPSDLVHSYFYEFTEAQFDLLRYSLEKIVGEAQGKRVAVFLIPAHRDVIRYHQSGDGPLARRLRELGEAHGFRVVDLTPYLHGYTPNWNEYYFIPCDYHWNALVNAVAAAALEQELRGFFY